MTGPDPKAKLKVSKERKNRGTNITVLEQLRYDKDVFFKRISTYTEIFR